MCPGLYLVPLLLRSNECLHPSPSELYSREVRHLSNKTSFFLCFYLLAFFNTQKEKLLCPCIENIMLHRTYFYSTEQAAVTTKEIQFHVL